MLELVNEYVAKIVLAAEDGDSINRISEKIGASYSYTYEWIERLEEAGVVERDDGVHVVDEAFADAFRTVAEAVVARELTVADAYMLPNFAGLQYRYAKTDAVFIWTRGGYQIGRSRDDYPIFIDVLAEEVDAWEGFFDDFSVDYHIGERRDEAGGIYFVLFPCDDVDAAWFEQAFVTPLDETVEWARQYEANFQPALEMLDEMYDLGLGITYRERSPP